MEGMGSKSPYGGQLLAVGQLVGETVGFPTLLDTYDKFP